MAFMRLATSVDEDAVWEIICTVIRTGDTYVFDPNSPKEKMLGIWFGPDKQTYVAEEDGAIVGTFFLKENQPDLGNHIANAGYMVAPDVRSRGVGRQMAEFSLAEARRLGFTAMQFNLVVKTNEKAVRLWQQIGFQIVGEIPNAFRHPQWGATNAYIMYQEV